MKKLTKEQEALAQQLEIRLETLTTGAEWVEPTGDEVQAVIRKVGFTGSETASYVGLKAGKTGSGSRTVRRWVSGEKTIPYAAWALLIEATGLGVIWK